MGKPAPKYSLGAGRVEVDDNPHVRCRPERIVFHIVISRVLTPHSEHDAVQAIFMTPADSLDRGSTSNSRGIDATPKCRFGSFATSEPTVVRHGTRPLQPGTASFGDKPRPAPNGGVFCSACRRGCDFSGDAVLCKHFHSLTVIPSLVQG